MSGLKNIAIAFLFLSLISASAVAQNAKAASDKSQAMLTIQINVVPTVAAGPQVTKIQNNQSISYSIPVTPSRLSVNESVREEVIHGAAEQVLVKTVVAE